MRKIISAEDWKWYTMELDVEGRYGHRHNGKPDKYPCVVSSSFWDDPNGPCTYDHQFFYQEEHTCESCGHKTLKFPVPQEESIKGS